MLILTCEHAVNTIPVEYQALFQDNNSLNTHYGKDIGALEIARYLSKMLHAPLVQSQVTRLLIDCNRSLNHKNCFSKQSRDLKSECKQKIIESYYLPFQQAAENLLKQKMSNEQPVLHLSVHSFTPNLNGVERNTSVGLLYDPRRRLEKNFARVWQTILKEQASDLRVRMNYPYLGKSNAFTTMLRNNFPENLYLGMELEVNQAILSKKTDLLYLYEILARTLNLSLLHLKK